MFDLLRNNVGCSEYHGGYMRRFDLMFELEKICCLLLHLPGLLFSGVLLSYLVPFRFPYTFHCAF